MQKTSLPRTFLSVAIAITSMISIQPSMAVNTAPPSAITLSPVTVEGTSATFRWTQKNAPADRLYKVEIKNLSNPKVAPVVLKTKNSTLLYENLTPATKYEVRVQLTFGMFFYPWSPKVSFSTFTPAPAGLEISNITSISASLTWNKVAGASGYKIYLADKLIGTTSEPNFPVGDLAPNSIYKVSVSTVSGSYESKNSVPAIIKTLAQTETISSAPKPNETITAVTVSDVSFNGARITWVTASAPKTFTIKLFDATGLNQISAYDISGDLRTYFMAGIPSNSTFQVSVVRNNADGTSSAFPLTTFTTSRNPAISLTATPATTSSVNLSWMPVPGAAYYEIFRDGLKFGDNITGTASSAVVSGLTGGYIYTFAVRVAYADANKNIVISELTNSVTGSPLPDANYVPSVGSVPTIQLPYASVPVVGATLTATPGIWNNAASITSYNYQWQRSVDNGQSWVDIAGMTGSQYVVVSSDYQYKLRVSVTARNNNGATTSNSAASGVVDALYNVQIPIVRGILIPGQVLETNDGVWSSKFPMTFVYQWLNNGNPITGEQTPTYTLTNADLGARITVNVTAITSLGSLTVTSALRSPVMAVANTALPVVTGEAKTFNTLTTTIGTWIGNPTGTQYQWQRSLDMQTWDTIPGATASTYTTVLADAGYYIRSEVFETKTVNSLPYKVSAASLPTPQIAVLTVTVNNTVLPAITGSWNVGQTLSLSNGSWSTTGTFTYQWQTSSNGSTWSDIAGATGSTYLLTNSEAGLYVRAKVLNVSGVASGFAYSNVTAKIGAPFNTATPTVAGILQVGETQTVSAGTWSGSPTYTYQWQSSSDGIAWASIAGATNSTFVMTYALSNLRIRGVVYAANAVDTVTAVTPTISSFAPPRVSIIPVITGTTTVGQVLTSTNGTWPNTSSGYEYQWQRSSDGGASWVNINSAVNTTYTLVSGDAGYVIRSQVSVRNNTGTSTAYSLPTAVIAP